MIFIPNCHWNHTKFDFGMIPVAIWYEYHTPVFAVYFEEIYSALQHKRKNCLQMQLGLKVDEFQILRCYGHYANAVITDEMKYPKLLPHRIHFTKLVLWKFICVLFMQVFPIHWDKFVNSIGYHKDEWK